MSTHRRYYKEPYLASLESKVTDIRKDDGFYRIVCEQSIFHPQGGGQASDSGTLGQCEVIKLSITADDTIEHWLDEEAFDQSPICIGENVRLNIDLQKRLQHACLHSAGHVIDGIIKQNSNYHTLLSYPKGHHFPGQAKIIYNIAENTHIDLAACQKDIEQAFAKLVAQKHPIQQRIDTKGTRMIKIADFAWERCGGTHLNNTEEIALFNIRKIKHRKGQFIISYTAEARDCH
jgi:alanyl-tRNA synthetase